MALFYENLRSHGSNFSAYIAAGVGCSTTFERVSAAQMTYATPGR